MISFLVTVRLVHCNNTILLSLFKQMKDELTLGKHHVEDWIKNLPKDVTRDTSYLVADNQTFFQ